MTSKGQVTIPLDVRTALGLEPGDKIVFEPTDKGYLVAPSAHGIERLAGMFGPYKGPPVSIERMNEDIAIEAAR
jgi:AbrB family looped-hinge helix DNA binding protein